MKALPYLLLALIAAALMVWASRDAGSGADSTGRVVPRSEIVKTLPYLLLALIAAALTVWVVHHSHSDPLDSARQHIATQLRQGECDATNAEIRHLRLQLDRAKAREQIWRWRCPSCIGPEEE